MDLARVRVVTFDCYGTLVDWETGILAAVLPILGRHGVTAASDEVLGAYARAESAVEAGAYLPYHEVLRRTFAGMAQDLGFMPEADERDALVAGIGRWRPFVDTVPALRELGERVKLGIVSNVDDDLFRATAASLQIDFDLVVTAEQARAYKPSPVPFELAWSRVERLVEGDRSRWLHAAQSVFHDLVPARMLNIPCAHVERLSGRESGAVPDVPRVEPDLRVADMAALAEAFR